MGIKKIIIDGDKVITEDGEIFEGVTQEKAACGGNMTKSESIKAFAEAMAKFQGG